MFDLIKDFFTSCCSAAFAQIKAFGSSVWNNLRSVVTGVEGYGPIAGRIAALFDLIFHDIIENAIWIFLTVTTLTVIGAAAFIVIPEILIGLCLMFVIDFIGDSYRDTFWNLGNENAQPVAA